MSEHFCTYFDHRYAPKALAMWRSLKQHSVDATLHALCLNDACREIVSGLNLPDVYVYSLASLEAADPALLDARKTRSLVEYYFTLTPCLPLYVFAHHHDIARLTYVDADLFFFADPQPVLDEVGENAVGLIEHRFPNALRDLEKYGRFNVGWLTFRNDSTALGCLEVWREQCLDWCYDRLEPGRFAEQKYLDEWPLRYKSVRVIQHRGANVGPWNLNRFELSAHGNQIRVGGQPMIFFHAHGFQPGSPGRSHVLNLERYGVGETSLLLCSIFEPYEKAVVEATTEIAVPLALALLSDQSREMVLLLETRQAIIEGLRSQLEGSEADRAARLDVINVLQAQLEASDADRVARLDVIRAKQLQLDASEADRAARLSLIQTLQARLAASEADRATRLDLIQTLETRLAASEADRAARLDLIQTLETRLGASEADRAARLDIIQTLQTRLAASEADRAARLDIIQTLQTRLDTNEADRDASRNTIKTLQTQVDSSQADLDGVRMELRQARSRVEAMELSRSWRWTRPVRWVLSRLRGPDRAA
jgi:hypothetical protein